MRHAAKLTIAILTLAGIACATPTAPTHNDCSGGSQQWDKCMQSGAATHP